MAAKNILNFALLLIFLALISIIYFSEEENNALDRLTSLNTESINTIKIQRNNNTTIIDKNEKDHWAISTPIKVDANDFRINTLLKLLNAPVHKKYSLADIDLNKIGLTPPLTQISFNDTNIAFGITNPVTNLRYVMLDNVIYTIQDAYSPLINSHFSTLVSLNLLPTKAAINKLILNNQTLSTNTSGLWQSNIEIDNDTINEIIDHWRSAQAFGIHEYIERTPLAEVFVYLDNRKKSIPFIVTDKEPWLILARPDLNIEYHLKVENYNTLITPINAE